MVVYCMCPGDKTGRAVLHRARAMEFLRIKLLKGGLDARKQKGYPVEPFQRTVRLESDRSSYLEPTDGLPFKHTQNGRLGSALEYKPGYSVQTGRARRPCAILVSCAWRDRLLSMRRHRYRPAATVLSERKKKPSSIFVVALTAYLRSAIPNAATLPIPIGSRIAVGRR